MNANNGIPSPQTIMAGRVTNYCQILWVAESQLISKTSLFRFSPSTSIQLYHLIKQSLLENFEISSH